jgi:hypothetical protein
MVSAIHRYMPRQDRLIATDAKWKATLTPIVNETSEFVAMLTVSVRKLRRPAD